MRRFLTAAAIALPALAVSGYAESARAQATDSFAERAVVSCLSGATVSGLTSGLLLAPLANSGIGTPVIASAIAISAGIGCGAGFAFTTAAAGYSWAWRTMTAPLSTPAPVPAPKPVPTPTEFDKTDNKGMIHAAW